MAFETKEEVLERVLTMKRPYCPHCETEMQLWEVPPVNVGDGLGWGVPYLFLCFNDDCSCYTQGWDNLMENYAQRASYRCFNYPGEEAFEIMPVFSPLGAKGQVIDDQALAQEAALKENIKIGFSILADAYADQDGVAVLSLLTDSTQPARVRLKAAEMIGDIGELAAIDPIRGLKFSNVKIQEAVETAVKKIHERHFTRECPFCAEVIKARAKICKHCGQSVAGE